MALRVECHSGFQAMERPVRIHLGRRTVEVSEILDRWVGPDHRYFKVRGDDGATYILRLDLEAWIWELVFFDRRRQKRP